MRQQVAAQEQIKRGNAPKENYVVTLKQILSQSIMVCVRVGE